MTIDDGQELDDVEEAAGDTGWDALDVLRSRAAASRAARDEAVKDLRRSMTDGEIREDFGIDLRGIEG